MQKPFFSSQLDFDFIPSSGPSPSGREKVMIVLHGQGDSTQAFNNFDLELDIPWLNYIAINAPDKYEDGFSWYELEPNHTQGVRRSRKLLQKLIFDLNLQGFANRDIYLLGHSQGALMAYDLVMNSRESFAGVISVSGYVWFFRGWKKQALEGAAHNTPCLMTYGTRDTIIPVEEVTEDIRILSEAGLPVTAKAFNKGHDFNLTSEVPFIRQWIEFQEQPQKHLQKLAQNLTSPWTPRETLPLISAPRRRARTRIRL